MLTVQILIVDIFNSNYTDKKNTSSLQCSSVKAQFSLIWLAKIV